MRILALEPYYGGSHKAFLDGWRLHSHHEWELFTLPAYKWKWRMRHAPITFAEQLRAGEVADRLQEFDVLFCSDMLNLAEFLGLAPAAVRSLPSVAMFHENQLTYPSQHPDQRDLHFAISNITTALAADQVWFNSSFHRKEFLTAAKQWATKMPDYQPITAIESIERKAIVVPLGIEQPPAERRDSALMSETKDAVLNIVWAARWEHDKDPSAFFAAMEQLQATGCPFRLHVLGESFRNVPAEFSAAREKLSAKIAHWGFAETRQEYWAILKKADVVVSTAQHEFFGLSVIEAMAAGAVPLLPDRLSYPELLLLDSFPELRQCLYQGGPEVIVEHLVEYHKTLGIDSWKTLSAAAHAAASRFVWDTVAPKLDQRISDLPCSLV